MAVGNAPYQNQANVSAAVVKPTGVKIVYFGAYPIRLARRFMIFPQTRDEVLDIKNILRSDAILLLGAQATETAFKAEKLRDFKIIHLAFHGFADSRFPERSGVVLGVYPKSSDDGLLQVREITHLRFNADLVTLSACDTGIGKLQGEEGVTDLAEAFLVSGAKSVVASLWSADDTFTHALMDRSTRILSRGEGSGIRPPDAKLDLVAKYGKKAFHLTIGEPSF